MQSTKRERLMDTLRSGVQPGDLHEFGDAGEQVRETRRLYRLARGAAASIRKTKDFVGGFLIGLSVWTPIFVATAADEAEWQQFGLPAGVALLGVGIWLRLGTPLRRGRRPRPRNPAGPSRSGLDRVAT
jgi:hypothetical protein